MRIQPIANAFTAQVTGVRLAEALDGHALARINAAFLEHHVLVFRAQALSKPEQLRFTRQFGDIDVHAPVNAGADVPQVHTVSNLDAAGRPRAACLGSQHWHSDKSYRLIPSTATFLHAVDIPTDGGDTLFADMASAFEALPEARRTHLRGLAVVHDWGRSVAKTSGGTISADERRRWPPVAHPLARKQRSGRRALFMGQHASHIHGRDPGEGEALLAELETHATADEFVYAHHWREGDLLMWDNRCLLHRALDNFDANNVPRILHRTVTRGTCAPE